LINTFICFSALAPPEHAGELRFP